MLLMQLLHCLLNVTFGRSVRNDHVFNPEAQLPGLRAQFVQLFYCFHSVKALHLLRKLQVRLSLLFDQSLGNLILRSLIADQTCVLIAHLALSLVLRCLKARLSLQP